MDTPKDSSEKRDHTACHHTVMEQHGNTTRDNIANIQISGYGNHNFIQGRNNVVVAGDSFTWSSIRTSITSLMLCVRDAWIDSWYDNIRWLSLLYLGIFSFTAQSSPVNWLKDFIFWLIILSPPAILLTLIMAVTKTAYMYWLLETPADDQVGMTFDAPMKKQMDNQKKKIDKAQRSIVINSYTWKEDDNEEDYDDVEKELKTFLEENEYCVDPNDVDLDKSDYENLVEKIKNAKHTISVITRKSVDNFFKDEEHYQVWLRALHKALDGDNVLSHIIFCVDVDVEKVTWNFRQLNPCIKYSSENDDWKNELLDVLKLGKKSVKTLKHVNAGEALAWSHYTGFVSFLQNIGAGGHPKDERVWRAENGQPVINELVMVVPKDCRCRKKKKHPLIRGPNQSEKYSFHRAGKERELNADLYKQEGIEKAQRNIVINSYTWEEDENEDDYDDVEMELKTFLEENEYCVDPNDVDLDKSDYENVVEKIKNAKQTISVVTRKSVDNFFKDEEHYQVWLRALHKALDGDNVLSHIIFCVDVDVEKVTWYLRQFNPCIKYSSENDDWKNELLAVLKLGKKSVKTLKHVNAGEALAWLHYTGYVSFLQNIGAGGDPKDESVWRAENGQPVINELVMIVPKDCHCPNKIEHPLIEGPYQSEKYSFHRAGKERKLNADLYKLEGIEKLVPIASTPSIETLRLLKEEKDLDEKWLQDQRKRYIAVLKERIKNNEYLKRKVILIDEDDKEDLVSVILRRIEKACRDQQNAASNPGSKDAKKLSVYLRSNKDDDGLAEKIQCTIEKAMPNLNIVNTHHRIVGVLPHSESLRKIEEADQCIFLLTDHKETISAITEVCTCLDKVLECDNKRATILLYTKEAKEVQQDIFKLLAKHFVAKVQYGKDGWEKKLMEAITDIQARPLQSAVNFHNISEGLAFGYLYCYLKLFLPEFSKELERVKTFPKYSNVMPKKIFILMPKSGYSPKTLQATDDTHLKELIGKEKRITGTIKYRVGCQERDFSATEYSLKDEDGTEYFVAAEFLTPLQALTEMRNDIFADMSYKQKRDQQRNLRKVMLEIQKSGLIPKEVEDKFLLLEIEDEEVHEKGKPKMIMTDADKLKLYHRELLKTVKEELRRERENPEEQVAQQMEEMAIQ